MLRVLRNRVGAISCMTHVSRFGRRSAGRSAKIGNHHALLKLSQIAAAMYFLVL